MPVDPGWGTVTLGRFTLRETFTVGEDDSRLLKVAGQTSVAGLSAAQVERIYEDLYGLKNQFIPITFSDKMFLTGYYTVTGVKTDYSSYAQRAVSPYPRAVVLNWELSCQRVGPASVVDIEARLSGPQTRLNDFGVIGEITHAPPVGHYGYTTAGTAAPSVSRASADGPITVYRQIPPNTHPRYGCAPADFGRGRVRYLDGYGEERTGTDRTTPAAGWELSNGLVRVRPSVGGGLLEMASWTVGGWAARVWDVQRNGATIAPFTDVDVLHNTYDTIILRLTTALSPGRIVVDAQLRRGSRMVELFIQTDTSATLKARLLTGEPGVAGTGTVSSIGEDADGGRYVIASARTATADLTNGGMSVPAASLFSVVLGAVPANAPLNPNWDMESGTTGWSGSGGTVTQTTEQAKRGTHSLKLVTDGAPSVARIISDQITILPVTGYTVACWVRCPNGRAATVDVQWLNPASTVVGTVTIPMTLPPNTWTPTLRDITSPATATKAVIRVTISQAVPWSALAVKHWNQLATWAQPIPFTETLYLDAAPLRQQIGGDSVADMFTQALGSVSELVAGVRR